MNRKDVHKVTQLCFDFQGFMCFHCWEAVKVTLKARRFNSSTSHGLECRMGIDRSEEA